jgi:hypothetical protein
LRLPYAENIRWPFSSSWRIVESKPVRILNEPKPELPKYYGKLDVQAPTQLKVESLADRSIGKIVVISGMPDGDLIGLAIDAATKTG